MFLRIEGDRLINLGLISQVVLRHNAHERYAIMYNAGVMECESHIAYEYFTNPGNAKDLYVVPAPPVEKAA